jgi:hypothetical protein
MIWLHMLSLVALLILELREPLVCNVMIASRIEVVYIVRFLSLLV